MECWAENNWKSFKNSQDGKSNECVKQTDDFLETFPNFMTLTDEERHEFFQTLYAAKVKLEKSGVTVKPYFGTVHDRSWNVSGVLEEKKEKSADDGISTSSRFETRILQSNTPTQSKISSSVSRFSTLDSRNSVIHENVEKNLKEDEICPALSQENSKSSLETNTSLKNLNLEEEIEIYNEVHRNNSAKSLKVSFTTPSSSYDGLSHDGTVKRPGPQILDLLKIKGTKLKVQVTLTSGDNERMGKILPKVKASSGDAEKCSGKKPNPFCSTEDKKLESEDTKSAEGKINDSELKDLLNVEEDNKEADLPEEKEKPRPKIICKKSFEVVKGKAKMAEGSKKTVPTQGRKKELTKTVPQNQLALHSECQLESTSLGNDKTLQRSDTKIIIGEEKAKTNVRERSDNATQTSGCDLVIPKEGSSEPKETVKETQQSIPAVATVEEEIMSYPTLEKRGTEVAGKKQNNMKSDRQMRVEKLQKYLQKREDLYQQKVKRKNDEVKKQTKEKSPDLKKKNVNEEEVISAKSSKVASVNSLMKDKEKAKTSTISGKKTVAVACSTEEMKEVKTEIPKTEGRRISDSNPTMVPHPTPKQVPLKEKEKSAVSKSVKETPEECVPLSLKRGKLVFVENDVVEKIKNVILDLEEKAKAYNCDTENEYLILIVEYVEYLSTVMATLFEDQALNRTTRNLNVKSGEEVSTPTTEDEFQAEEELEIKKSRKGKKIWNILILRRLAKFFKWGKKKKHREPV